MAWSKTQSTSKDTNTVTSDNLAFASNNDPSSEGNHIIVVSFRFGNSGQTFTCSDSQGNTYVPVTAQASNSWEIDSGSAQTDCCVAFYALAIKPNAANTVTVQTSGAAHRFTWDIAEFAPGAGKTVTFNAGPIATQFATGTTAFNAGAVTTTGSAQLVFNVVQADSVQSSWT